MFTRSICTYFTNVLSGLLDFDLTFDESFLLYDFLSKTRIELDKILNQQPISLTPGFERFDSFIKVLLIAIFDKVEIFVKHWLHTHYNKENIVS